MSSMFGNFKQLGQAWPTMSPVSAPSGMITYPLSIPSSSINTKQPPSAMIGPGGATTLRVTQAPSGMIGLAGPRRHVSVAHERR